MAVRTELRSPFMEFLKLEPPAKYPLGASAVASMTFAELGATAADLELHGTGFRGYRPLLEHIARYCDVDVSSVVAANGCSMANHLAFSACLEPGDEVLLETPTYELLLKTLQFLGAQVRRFQRPPQAGFAIDPGEIESLLTPRTRLIVLCNLHNPSSARVDEPTLRAIGDLAKRAGARVLVNEVYLESISPRPATTLKLGPQFVVTSSLNKGYGLSGLRCGWILAEPDLADRIWRLNDFFGGHQPHVSDRLSAIAFERMDLIRERARRLLDANRVTVTEFLRSRSDLDCFIPESGTTLFPRLKDGDVDALAQRLRTDYDTMIVPGRYFEAPQHFRLGLGIATDTLCEGLRRLGQALDDMR